MPQVLVWIRQLDLRGEVCAELRAHGVPWDEDASAEAMQPRVVVASAPSDAEAVRDVVTQLGSRWRIPPAVVLVAPQPGGPAVAEALAAGADELVPWPQRRAELAPRVKALLRRRREDLGRHPLTGLPGGPALWAALQETQSRGQTVAVLSVDLRHFKAFNDRYGFARADCVLCFVANLLEAVAQNAANVYHIGGDDFCLLCAPEAAEGLAARAVESFAAGVAYYYDEADRRAGGFLAPAREDGALCWYPLMALTVACVVVGAESPAEEVSRLLSSLRMEAKLNGPGSGHNDPAMKDVPLRKEEA